MHTGPQEMTCDEGRVVLDRCVDEFLPHKMRKTAIQKRPIDLFHPMRSKELTRFLSDPAP